MNFMFYTVEAGMMQTRFVMQTSFWSVVQLSLHIFKLKIWALHNKDKTTYLIIL